MTSFGAMKSGDILGGRYELTQEIGKGAMGAVWAAHDLESNRSVAVKFILPQEPQTGRLTNDLRQRLLREARVCGKLCHRNIVQIFDVAETADGEPFLVLELLHGQTLGQLLEQRRRIEPAMAARILAEAASGLAAAHAAQVIHRDLKPANLYLHREEGMPVDRFVLKILDFGVCKTIDSVDSILTHPNTAVGTPAYMSPEQVAMRKDLDHRTDIWSLGIVLYELLTGARPFSGTVAEVVRQVLLTPVPPPSAKVRDVPPELDRVVASCTAAKRENRYASAQDVANALFAIAETLRPAERKTGNVGKLPPPSIRVPNTVSDAVSSVRRDSRPTNASSTVDAPSSEADDADAAPTILLLDRVDPDALKLDETDERSTGTQILLADEVVGSPDPPWKQEMKEILAAHRHTPVNLDFLRFEKPAAEQAPPVVPTMHSSSTGQPGASKMQPSAEETTSGTTMPLPHPTSAPLRRRRRSTVMLGAAAIVVVAMIVGVGFAVTNQDKRRESMNETAPETTLSAVPVPIPVIPPPLTSDAPPANTSLPRETAEQERKASPPEHLPNKVQLDDKARPSPEEGSALGVTGVDKAPPRRKLPELQGRATKTPEKASNSEKKPCTKKKIGVFTICS